MTEMTKVMLVARWKALASTGSAIVGHGGVHHVTGTPAVATFACSKLFGVD